MLQDKNGYSLFDKRAGGSLFINTSGLISKHECQAHKLALFLNMDSEEFIRLLMRDLKKGKKIKGIRYKDGVMVFKEALGRFLIRIKKEES